MVDILLFIPRLVWDILVLIWGVISTLGEALIRFVAPHGEPFVVYVGFVIWLLLVILLRKEFGGIAKAMLYVTLCLIAAMIMYAINPWGLAITILAAVLAGVGILSDKNWVYPLLGVMWVAMIIYKVMA